MYMYTCIYYMYILHVHITCIYYMYMLHVYVTCICYMYILHVYVTDICSWDIYEYLRQNPDVWVDSKGVEPPLSLMIQQQCCLCSNVS